MRRTVLGRGPAVYAAIVALLAIYLVTTVGQSAADVVAAVPDTNTAIQLQHGHTHGMELLHGRSAAAINATAVPSALTCDGDGTSGKRVQLVYLRGDGQSDRYNQMVSSFRQQASQVDAYINAAAQHTGGERHVRYVHDSACNPVVDNQVVPQSAMDGGFLTAVRVLEQQRGYNRADRKYMIWYEGTDVCGVSWGVPGDDRPGADNGYNGGPNYGLTGTSCWTFNAQLHELLHGLGGVQRSAPHSTTNGHCWDDEDVLCYNDGGVPNPPGDMVKVCTTGDVDQVDCNNDDYFSVQPPSGSYLATRWNTANNQFLIVGSSTGATPSPSTSPSQPQPEPQPQPSGTAWAPNTTYGAGTTVTYGGRSYQCLQAHTSLPGWEPPNVLALWRAL
jgi:hypothetical protein